MINRNSTDKNISFLFEESSIKSIIENIINTEFILDNIENPIKAPDK